MKELSKLCVNLLKNQTFDSLAVGIIDFTNNSIETIDIEKKNQVTTSSGLYFDLASLTKPLTLSSTYFSRPELFDEDMLLLLEHRGGLPAGGRLSRNNWENKLLQYQIIKSETLYSDYSALRLMLEIEAKQTKSLGEICSSCYDKDLKHWSMMEDVDNCAITGFRKGRIIQRQVHDDNAYQLGRFLSHAGLFSTANGLCKTLINMNTQLNLLSSMSSYFDKKHQRFIRGFDTVQDLSGTLAGKGCSAKTFGHLGFTGTSFWIDIEKKRGAVILTNGTQNFWYARQRLNHLRQEIGSYIWSK